MTRDEFSSYLHQTLDSGKKGHLKRTYNLSFERLVDMVFTQQGRCAICKCYLQFKTRKWHVDHDHETGKVRGLLCHFCNTSLVPVFDTHAKFIPAVLEYLGADTLRFSLQDILSAGGK